MREREKKFHLIFEVETNSHDIFQVCIILNLETDGERIIEWYSTEHQQLKQ